jgi:hypothetical protein
VGAGWWSGGNAGIIDHPAVLPGERPSQPWCTISGRMASVVSVAILRLPASIMRGQFGLSTLDHLWSRGVAVMCSGTVLICVNGSPYKATVRKEDCLTSAKNN